MRQLPNQLRSPRPCSRKTTRNRGEATLQTFRHMAGGQRASHVSSGQAWLHPLPVVGKRTRPHGGIIPIKRQQGDDRSLALHNVAIWHPRGDKLRQRTQFRKRSYRVGMGNSPTSAPPPRCAPPPKHGASRTQERISFGIFSGNHYRQSRTMTKTYT